MIYSLHVGSHPLQAAEAHLDVTAVARDWQRSIRAVGGYWLGSFALSEEDLTRFEASRGPRALSVHPAEAIIERVTGPTDRADRIGHVTAVDRLAQAADMHIDRSFVDIDVRAPDAIE